MTNEIIKLEEFKKQYVVLLKSEDFATNIIRLRVYDLEERIYKTLEFSLYDYYKYFS